jgi:hypothetical protein
MTGTRTAVAGRVAAADPAGLLYGAIVSASVLASVSAHAEDFDVVVLTTAGAVLIYWLAHVYIAAQSLHIAGDQRHVLRLTLVAAGHESSVLKGGGPAILVYLVAVLFGLGKASAALVAVWFSVALLIGVGYLAAHRSGRTGGAALVDAGVAGLFGLVVVLGKTLLH